MSNWDLMMPGMGLTAIGLAGLTLSYADLAHTFIDGMHALTGLTMFVGLIFLATGILDGGVSTSNRAKATVLVVLSISLGFGMFALTWNTSNYTITLAGILMAIAFPSIIIAYLAMKHPTLLKPVGSIVGMAGATGVIVWFAFGFVSPDQYIIPQAVEVVEPENADVVPKEPTFAIEILEGSATQGNPDYDPDVATVSQGHTVKWTNADSVAHTATSFDDQGETFDTSLLDAGKDYSLDTTEITPGEYEYFCIVHPWMVSTLIIEEAKEPAVDKVVIPEGAGFQVEEQVYYDPKAIDVGVGTTVIWDNLDSAVHTVTSGVPPNSTTGVFDSDIMMVGDKFEFTFTDAGSHDYFCILHPWMVGTVNVE